MYINIYMSKIKYNLKYYVFLFEASFEVYMFTGAEAIVLVV